MNLEAGSFTRCVKHPSQFFTGFCSTCLVERLSNVGSVESTSYCIRNGVDSSDSVPSRKSGGIKVRKTLLSLFKLEDLNESENRVCDLPFQKVCSDYSLEITQPGLNVETGSQDLDDRSGSRLVSVSGSASGNTSADNVMLEPLNNVSLKENGILLWLHSKIKVKGLKWRRSASMKVQMQDMCLNSRIRGKSMENKSDLQNSLKVRGSHDLNRISWEKPRHSWDGSMMSKALTCSFSCLEERQEGSFKIKKTSPNEAVAIDPQTSAGEIDLCKLWNKSFPGHSSLYPNDNFVSSLKEAPKEESIQEIAISDVCRKKSHGWHRVWDWSIPSPFRDFSKRGGHVLERSFSESWRDNHKDTIQPDTEASLNGNTLSHATVSRSSTRGIFVANGDRLGVRPEWQKMREFKLSRSRSVHYSSPQNLDNGLLRFYLTPLRTSRRNKAKCRRNSHPTKVFLGL